MVKIGVITFHNACNYGAVCQAYSLLSTLKRIDDVEASIIDYRCPKIEIAYSPTKFLKTKGSILRRFKNIVTGLLRFRATTKRNELFRETREKLFCSDSVVTKSDLDVIEEKYDLFIAGSDQIWNLKISGNDMTYFLNFVESSEKKFSYAVSTGGEMFNDFEDEIKAYLNNFSIISTREKTTAEYIKKLVPNTKVEVNIDPVFLSGKKFWEDFAHGSTSSEGHILFFVMGYSNSIDRLIPLAKNIAGLYNSELLFLSDYERWYKYRYMTHIGVASPESFVGYIQNAKYVITNSFHATALCIILHVSFYVDMQTARNERIKNLLSMFNLEKRGIDEVYQLQEITDISSDQWEAIDVIIKSEQERSLSYFNTIISQTNI